jgi:peptide/nickel transport system substrate-binding protein
MQERAASRVAADLVTNKGVRANGDDALYGVAAQSGGRSRGCRLVRGEALDEEQLIMHRLNRAALDHVVHVPLAFWLSHQAWRKNVSGIVKGPLPFFWGVRKTV